MYLQDSANDGLGEVVRKISNQSVESTGSDQTQQSQGSSVIINKKEAGKGKHEVRSQVINCIKTQNEGFNPNVLYNERKKQLLSRLNDECDDVGGSMNVRFRAADTGDNMSQPAMKTLYTSQQNMAKGRIELCGMDSDEEGDSEFEEGNDSDQSNIRIAPQEFIDDDFISSSYCDEDEFMLYSPPRSPPTEVDPKRLYGLFDFVGTDPQHCKLKRDEPVYLVNDEDSYWWLVKKLTKEERVSYERYRLQDNMNKITAQYDSDDEDGKIGFVPAECLETYGERLARLNCFKNEELERTNSMLATSKLDNSLSKKNSLKCGKMTKSVTFEGSLDDSDTESYNSIGRSLFENSNISILHSEINNFTLEEEMDEKTSEVLSDIYPSTVPLSINKNNKTTQNQMNELSSSQIGKESTTSKIQVLASENPESSILYSDSAFGKPVFSASFGETNVSIGSFSPDTPPLGHERASPKDAPMNENSVTFKRSDIMDRLNKVTSDIQEQLQIDDFESNSDLGSLLLGFEFSPNGSDYNVDDDDRIGKEIEQNSNLASQLSALESSQQIYSLAVEEDDESECKVDNSSSTPLTSTQSLNNIVNCKSSEKSGAQESVPVHEMFLPILGKLDQIANKLAELEELI